MAYLPADLTAIAIGPETEPYWEGCKQGELRFQRCLNCGTFRHPPAPVCYACRARETEWVCVSGRGTVYTYTVVHHPVHPKLTPHIPYNVALVALEDAPGVRLVSNVIDVAPEELRIGLPVEVVFEESISDTRIPRFKVAK
jgi:uncharacterized OB-fold protein